MRRRISEARATGGTGETSAKGKSLGHSVGPLASDNHRSIYRTAMDWGV